MSFIPICNQCLSEIDGATQGLLLSCGHFICHGCCRGTKPTTCPHCGVRARAAVLDDPPAEIRDYLQNPSTQLKAADDVVMFQLDHFRAAAKQRPIGAQAHPAGGCSGGGGGQSGLYPSAAPPRQARAGTETESSSRRMRAGSLPGQPRSPAPRSPLLAARPGTLKRPSSGSLPAPKRQGPASAGDKERGTSCGRRAGTSTPILRASSPLVQIRSTQLPFTPNSASRPGSGQRPRKTSGGSSSSSSSKIGAGGKPPTTADDRRAASSIPLSLEAAGLFPRRPDINGGWR